MPIAVTDQNRLPLHTISPGITSVDTEVVLILDASKANEIAENHYKEDFWDGPDLFKLSDCQRFLKQVPPVPLELPIIFYNVQPHVRFCDGRHRTTALVDNGLKTVPVLTSQKIANGLTHLWGSKQTAMNEYDFSNCVTKMILGT
ncbi:hypothetical protein SAMN05660489_04532 [Pseudomonas sp. LAMO17WK12:I10]|uniref:hypothetical protein n=1 Tax=unclassified Pseudomonas TaxID=196821 RepID=UPI000BDB3401|nr:MULTISPECIES: hypothetical protein [unclassified Pseudomonas]PXX59507.1 hypothetical protein H160_04627 [Pseudomonas sp. LAMO17WK12:I9]SNY46641.1 hypothetical protein SAMN05660489_04532 [Pseudomonas sp. LAMO17WK12:I10]